MNGHEFFDLTKKVRAAQKLYFRSRLHGDLIAAKGLESQLDQALKNGIDPEPTVHVYTTEEYQRQLEFIEHSEDNFVTTYVSSEEDRPLRLRLEDERDAGEIEKDLEDTDEQ